MSIATEITRLQNAKTSIKNSIEAKGVTVPSNAKLDSYSSYVDQIQTGGGGSEERIAKLINNQLTSLIPSDFISDVFNTPNIVGYTFKNKTSITSITFPQQVQNISAEAFAGCTGLTSFTAPNCSSLASSALAGCKNLQTLDLSNVTNLGSFSYFINQSTIPSSSQGFINLTSITFPSVNQTFYSSANGKYGLANTTSLTSITLPSLKSGQTLTQNSAKGFLYNSGISSAYIPDGVNYVAESMFEHCQNLTSVSLPAGLVQIGASAFKDCPLLTSLTFRGTKAQWGSITFGSNWKANSGLTTIHCSDGDITL